MENMGKSINPNLNRKKNKKNEPMTLCKQHEPFDYREQQFRFENDNRAIGVPIAAITVLHENLKFEK